MWDDESNIGSCTSRKSLEEALIYTCLLGECVDNIHDLLDLLPAVVRVHRVLDAAGEVSLEDLPVYVAQDGLRREQLI